MMYEKMSDKGLKQELVDIRREIEAIEGKLEYARGAVAKIWAEIYKREQDGD